MDALSITCLAARREQAPSSRSVRRRNKKETGERRPHRVAFRLEDGTALRSAYAFYTRQLNCALDHNSSELRRARSPSVSRYSNSESEWLPRAPFGPGYIAFSRRYVMIPRTSPRPRVRAASETRAICPRGLVIRDVRTRF